jgi:long-chain acyl-CoA synthetase
MARANLTSLFREFERYARDVAVVQRRGYRRECWSYGRLAEVAVGCAAALKQRGVRAGERVILWGPNSAEWMAAFWGCLLRGAVAVPLDDGATTEFAERVARETEAKLVWGTPGKAMLGEVPALNLEDLANEAWTSGGKAYKGAAYESLADEAITRSHIAQILFTSGTTAEPRGVVLTHGNFLANLEPLEKGIDGYRKYERWWHPLRFVTLVPLSHVFGQFMGLLVPPLLGATIVFEASTKAGEISRTIQRERATALIAVPQMLDGLRAGILREVESRGWGKDFRQLSEAAEGRKFLRRAWMFRRVHRRFGWKFWALISGGAALSTESEEFFRRMGYAVVQGYGMTETASLISVNHPFRAARGTIGKALPGREFRVEADGEILVRGENVSAGYWQQGALQAGDDQEWLRTGDLGELDGEGNLRFRGRKKSVIVTTAGLNVYPQDLESALKKQAGVRDCVVVAVERGGNEEACAAILMDEGAEDISGAERAVESANRMLAEYQRVRCWLVWPEIDFPRTPTGKPRQGTISAAVRQMFDGGAGGDGRVPVEGKGSGAVESVLRKMSGGDDARAGSESMLNLSSLDRVELMSALEERYQVELSETGFAEAKTVGDVEQLLREPAARRAVYAYAGWALRAPVKWLRAAVYYALVWPATQILAKPNVLGRENIERAQGPVLIVSNHVTRRADIGLILSALPGRYRHHLATAMGGETLQRMRRPPEQWIWGKRVAYRAGYWLVTALFNVFPLPQYSGFRESFRFAGEAVDRGYSVLVFPEGEVNASDSGALGKFQSGIGLLAQNLNVAVVPMRLDGVWKMKRERRIFAGHGEIVVRVGAPIKFAPGTSAEEIARQLESVVRSL